MNYDFNQNEILTVDIHGYKLEEARRYFEILLATLPTEIHEIIVIHGFRHGNSLLKFVRDELNSIQIERKFLSLNQGRTSLIIRH